MDELTPLRRFRADTPDTTEPVVTSALERARRRVVHALPHDAPTTTNAPVAATRPVALPLLRARPRVPARSVLAVSAAIAAVALGATAVTAFGPRGDSAAAAVLHSAADASLAAAPNALADGQFLRVDEREDALAFFADSTGAYTEAVRERSATTDWIPADRRGVWVREHHDLPFTTVYGDDGTRRAAEREAETGASRGDPGTVTRAAGGAFDNGEFGGTPAHMITTADIPALPRDPTALLRRIEAVPNGGEPGGADQAVEVVSGLLGSGLVPMDLQAAMYRALAEIPGLAVTHDQVALDGRSGTALALPSADTDERQEIIIDDDTGAYIGTRAVQLHTVGAVPAGTVASSSSIRMSIVTSAP